MAEQQSLGGGPRCREQVHSGCLAKRVAGTTQSDTGCAAAGHQAKRDDGEQSELTAPCPAPPW